MAIKIIKKGTKNVITLYSNKCHYCSEGVSSDVKSYNEHLKECKKKPVFSDKNVLKYFDLMAEKTNSVNNKKFTSAELASYLIDSQMISSIVTGKYSPVSYFIDQHPAFTDNHPVVTVDNGKGKLKVVTVYELINLYEPIRKMLNPFSDFIFRDFGKISIEDFKELLEWLKEVAGYYIKLKKSTFQETQNKNHLTEIEKMNWEIFPAGEWFENKNATHILFDYFRNLQNKGKWRNKFFDKSRLDVIYEKLNPQPPIMGKKRFEGYVVYFFDWTD